MDPARTAMIKRQNKSGGSKTTVPAQHATYTQSDDDTGEAEGFDSNQPKTLQCVVTVVVAMIAVFLIQCYYINAIISRLDNLELKRGINGIDLSQFVDKEDYSNERKNDKAVMDKLERSTNEYRINRQNDNQKLDGLVDNVNDLKIDLPNTFEKKQNKVKEDLEKLRDILVKDINSLKEISGTLTDKVDTAEEKLTHLDTDIRKAESRVEAALKTAEQQLKSRLEQMKEEHNEKITVAQDQLEQQLVQIYKDFNVTREVVDGVLMPNAFNKDAVLKAFIVFAILLVVLVVYMKRPSDNQGIAVNPAARHQPEQIMPIVQQIQPNQPLQNIICVVSFDENTQQAMHSNVVNEVLAGLPQAMVRRYPTEFRVVRNHGHILHLPPAKLYLMFVDFSERHVIIEETGLGLGDNKRTTVQAFQKHQADFMIIYVRDPGSRRLEAGRRYNRDIACVQRQATLKDLNQRQRFYSIYDTLSELQKQSIQSVIRDVFEE